MRKIILFILILLGLNSAWATKTINRVRFMPDMPSPYQIRDWKQVALDYDKLIFSFRENGTFFPLNKWDNRQSNYKGKSFSMVSYIGAPGGDEGINNIAAVVGATLVGVDKSNQDGQDFVAMCQKWFSSDNGANIYGNGLNSNNDWSRLCDWYSSMPNILAFQLSYLYPEHKQIRKQILTVADLLIKAADRLEQEDKDGFEDPKRQRDFGAAIAWMEYMAYNITGDKRYLVAADKGIKYVLNSKYNPLYEMILPYGALAACRMNAECGSSYDVTQLLNWCFDGDAVPRHGWGVIADRWGGYDMHGLQGSVSDGDGYAFVMNTYQMASSLTPMVRYDKAYAHDIGKWMLNLVNNSRMFYPDSYNKEHQSSQEWSNEYDKNSVIAYEGVRKWKRGWLTAAADYKTVKGRITKGNFRSTHFLKENPIQKESIAEVQSGNSTGLEHVWSVELAQGVSDRWIVVSAELLGANKGNVADISICDTPDGKYVKVLSFENGAKAGRPRYAAIPREYNKLYVKAATIGNKHGQPDVLEVDAIGVTYKTSISPYATGDFVVSFVDLIDNCSTPIVAYRPEGVATDLGLYGSSHVGILGAIASVTDVEGILQLDLLKTDYYRGEAYPTYLYYNPFDEAKKVTIDVGAQNKDLYNTISSSFESKGVSGNTTVNIPAKGTAVIVVAPSNGTMTLMGTKKFIDGVVVDFGDIR